MPLLKLEDELNDPQVCALVKDGWSIVQMLPVVDDGAACVILILRKKEIEITKTPYSRLELIQCIVLVFIAIAISALYIP